MLCSLPVHVRVFVVGIAHVETRKACALDEYIFFLVGETAILAFTIIRVVLPRDAQILKLLLLLIVVVEVMFGKFVIQVALVLSSNAEAAGIAPCSSLPLRDYPHHL